MNTTIESQPTTTATVCTVFNTRNGQWYSEACSSVKPYICRVKPAASTGAPCDLCRTGTCPTPPPPQRARPLCESGWTYWAVNGKCYKKLSGMKTWPIHEKMCNLLGAHLTSIHSDAEHEFLKNMSSTGLPMPGCQPTYCSAGMALGLKADAAGTWSWVDGTALDYTNWGGNGQRPLAGRPYSNFYPETFQDPSAAAAFNSKWDNYLSETGLNRGTVCKRDY
ncbi:CLEC-50 protein [Aphelenchoides avenae]|nr:CLEC-50 protein [Aphelenchus avenae]